MCLFLVIEAQIPREEDLRAKPSINFPAVDTSSTNISSVFGSKTPMIEIPSTIVLRRLEEGTYVCLLYDSVYLYQYIRTCIHTCIILS